VNNFLDAWPTTLIAALLTNEENLLFKKMLEYKLISFVEPQCFSLSRNIV
jgi:hypothetical protein